MGYYNLLSHIIVSISIWKEISMISGFIKVRIFLVKFKYVW